MINTEPTLIVYVHGQGGSAQEAEHYVDLFRENVVLGFDYRSEKPWDAIIEFRDFFESQRRSFWNIRLIANSIGAYFAMLSLDKNLVDEAFLISPIVDMEGLIGSMMSWAGVNEQSLKESGIIRTTFGEELSYDYLLWVRNHPLDWPVRSHILYGEKDHLQSMEQIRRFGMQKHMDLTVMPDGEHWFHTEEQMLFLDDWIRKMK